MLAGTLEYMRVPAHKRERSAAPSPSPSPIDVRLALLPDDELLTSSHSVLLRATQIRAGADLRTLPRANVDGD